MKETAGRLVSLDAFRGFTIAAMVLVNNPGDWSNLYPQLAHASWNGWTFTDTIFPFFLFIGGMSMALSLGRLAAAGADRPALLRKLAVRALLIFLIGFMLNLAPISISPPCGCPACCSGSPSAPCWPRRSWCTATGASNWPGSAACWPRIAC
jgi:predicted acyltransferase